MSAADYVTAWTIEPRADGTATWHCHLCDDAHHCPTVQQALDEGAAHADLWHTNGREATI